MTISMGAPQPRRWTQDATRLGRDNPKVAGQPRGHLPPGRAAPGPGSGKILNVASEEIRPTVPGIS
jgi:hypothetical protein